MLKILTVHPNCISSAFCFCISKPYVLAHCIPHCISNFPFLRALHAECFSKPFQFFFSGECCMLSAFQKHCTYLYFQSKEPRVYVYVCEKSGPEAFQKLLMLYISGHSRSPPLNISIPAPFQEHSSEAPAFQEHFQSTFFQHSRIHPLKQEHSRSMPEAFLEHSRSISNVHFFSIPETPLKQEHSRSIPKAFPEQFPAKQHSQSIP